MTSAIRSKVHSSPTNPLAVAPSSRASPAGLEPFTFVLGRGAAGKGWHGPLLPAGMVRLQLPPSGPTRRALVCRCRLHPSKPQDPDRLMLPRPQGQQERKEMPVIDHVGLGVSDLEQSKVFYQQALGPLGYQLLMERDGSVGLGRNGKPDFWIHANRPLSGPTHIAITSADRAHRARVPCRGAGGWRPRQRPARPAPPLPPGLLRRLRLGSGRQQHRGRLPPAGIALRCLHDDTPPQPNPQTLFFEFSKSG